MCNTNSGVGHPIKHIEAGFSRLNGRREHNVIHNPGLSPSVSGWGSGGVERPMTFVTSSASSSMAPAL